MLPKEKAVVSQAKSLAADQDAGLKNPTHYIRKLPKWRYEFRQYLLPLVRWETPYLAHAQSTCRSVFLDSYFAVTANLGTHTFFMTALPILFWCGYTNAGRALVHMLALGVFWSGFIKDLVCLPRPLSPPLHRITMSGSAALEYGFPSTHSTNAVSVATYYLYYLHTNDIVLPSTLRTLALTAGYAYATSIIIGRLYCGMHGFFDVVIGGLLGGLFATVQISCGESFNTWIAYGSWEHLAIVVVGVLVAVRFHPEPADNCPCFDDSVAFAGVLIGIEIGHWHFSKSDLASSDPVAATVPYSLELLGWPTTILRILLGVVVIFVWRASMKSVLLKGLPPIFRRVEQLGLSLPRRFFTRASQYKRVPPLRQDDNVIPSTKQIGGFISSLRHSRKRAVSIGPQSEADARELIANRERKRRESTSRERAGLPNFGIDLAADLPSPLEDPEPPIKEFPAMSTMTTARYKNPLLTPRSLAPVLPLTPPPSDSGLEDDRQDQEIFLSLEKPRVRYDVEVITKLVVYAGIAWLAVEGNPLLFHMVGLGLYDT